MFNKKAQAAMEFLMTYGWAILVVLVAIGALAYFGVLNPEKFLPERCSAPAGMDCIDKAAIDANSNQVTFVLKDNLGYKIDYVNVTNATDDCTFSNASIYVEDSSGNFAASSNNEVLNGRKIRISTFCSNDIATGRFKSDIKVVYRNTATDINHTATVTLTGVAN